MTEKQYLLGEIANPALGSVHVDGVDELLGLAHMQHLVRIGLCARRLKGDLAVENGHDFGILHKLVQ